MIWGSVFFKLGAPAAPGGQLFKLGVLAVAAYIAGYIISKCYLPGLLGMMLMGVLLRNINFVVFSGWFLSITSSLRSVEKQLSRNWPS